MVEKVGFLGRKLNILSLKRTMIFGLKKKIKKVEKEQNLDLNQDYDVKKKLDLWCDRFRGYARPRF